ncbi:MotA/TolQ/ExbB proton channel family protein [Limnochorda pilosa]|uniref:MotA/TolQ/ExbB proton channel family protein n=1 Tax=Limnochorda pilosa TaxID=1555112 RepID=A0A0K2SKL2_LIMPI|nr:MotA/TolQ/ExbB proton channel family protein [Limnochorda pilosa]BAS27557.1 MotA/TolQ/ExbB proton channel family protein [Limnochorda pilosa]
MVDIFIQGGPVMIPLGLLSLIGFAVFLERIWYLRRNRANTDELVEEVHVALEQERLLEAVQIAKRHRGPVAAVLSVAVANFDRPSRELRERIEQAGQDEVYKMERRLVWLETIAAIAPLLGLLGTVLGIIDSFQILSAAQGVGDPAAISSGIAQALITTAAGLIIAIPTLFAHNWLSSIVDRRVQDMNRAASEVVEIHNLRGVA